MRGREGLEKGVSAEAREAGVDTEASAVAIQALKERRDVGPLCVEAE